MSIRDAFEEFADPIWKDIAKLKGLVAKGVVVRSGFVSGVSPLMVDLVGSIDPATGLPVSAPAESIVPGLQIGDRVLCVEQHRRVMVITSRGPVPATQQQVDDGVDDGSYVTPLTLRGWAEGRDTGWVDLSGYLISPYSGALSGRIVGKTVIIRSPTMSGSVPSGTGVTTVTTAIPAALRPVGNMWGPAYCNGYTGAALLRGDGTIAIANRTGAAWPTNTQFTIASFTE